MPEARIRLEVDLDRLESNLRAVCRRVSPCRVMAVVKANAYGLGVRQVSACARDAGVSRFGVAHVSEALEIQDLGLPVQLLGELLPDEVADAVSAGIICPVTGLESARRLSAAAEGLHCRVNCQLKIDSGMGRLGMPAERAYDEIQMIAALPGLDLKGIYSHFSSAGTPENDYTSGQMEKFLTLLDRLEKSGLSFEDIHMAASDGISFYRQAFSAPFTMVRCGINMYGCCDPAVCREVGLEKVFAYRSKLVAVRPLPAGSCIGYSRMHVLKKDAVVGTVAAGYADGLPLALSNRGNVLIRGVRCPIIGRISMDYTTVLLDAVPDAEIGDDVTFFGKCGKDCIDIDELAGLKNTHAYDILCAVGPRVERVYLKKTTDLSSENIKTKEDVCPR